jgi:hypothetical protein
MDYQRAESGYLAKYLQQTAYPAESSSSHQFSSKEENKRSHSRVGVGGLKKIITILAVIGAATFLVAAYFILPKADLIVVPKKDSASFNIQVIADKNLNKVDYSLKKIPAQLIRIEKKGSKEFTATGKSSGSVKARGKILIYNAYSASPQTLVQNTRFVSNDTGKVFRITKNITVPGAKMEKGKLTPSSIETEVIADQAGSDYNIGPGKFSIPGFQGTPKYDGFYGVSNLTMSGGAQGEAIIVSSDDQKTARENLSEQIKIDINKAISEQISSNFKLLDGALKQGEPLISFSKQVGEAAEKFNASFSIDMTALVFDEKVINDLIDKIVIASSADKKETLSLSRKIDYQNTKINLEIGQIHMDISVQEEFTHKIDIAGLKKSLVGKNEGEIKLVLGQMPEILNLKVSLWPFWVRSIPAQADKINIIIE